MKYKKILTWACTAALFLTGCTTDTASNGRWMEDSNAVRIQASAGSTLTRSNPIATDEKQTSFNQGDMISVRNRNITVNYTFDGEKLWVPENGKYLVWDEKNLTFEAYYPCDDKNDFSVGYIKKDQRTLENLAKSDYMRITSNNLTEVPSDKRLPLELKRQTARLILKIQKFNDEFSTEAKVTELGIGCPENTNRDGSWESIRPYQQNGDGGVGTTYTALVIPGKRTVYITPPNTNLDEPGIEDLKVETGELEAGKSYTYNLIVGKDKVTVGGVTVAPWNTGTPLPEGVAEEEDLTPYVTMTAASKQTFSMLGTESYIFPEDLECSVNNKPWEKVKEGNIVEFGGDLGSLRLRGKCYNGTATNDNNYSWINFGNPDVKVDCSGDIRTLIDYTAYENAASGNCRFCSLFKGCEALKSALELLLATALKDDCYNSMFQGCTSLEQAPDLPATVLRIRCYDSMFKGCTALKQAPDLPARDLAWFCYEHMFDGCTSLVDAPALPATTLQPACYSYMFANCESLKIAPELGAEELVYTCYFCMFQNCKKLESVTMLATSVADGASGYLNQWLYDAGTNAEEIRTLRVSNKDFYDSKIAINTPAEWKPGQGKVWESNGNEILEIE